jgi:hypothetical protein
MRAVVLLASLAIILAGCGRKSATTVPGGPAGSVLSAEQPGGASARGPARGPRRLNGVPPGHYPKPGECRLWVPGRPPGQQARPTACRNIPSRIPAGAFILYGNRAWDTDYDWIAHASREQGSVPDVIIGILRGRR